MEEMEMSVYTWAWIMWGVMFLAIEGVTAFNKPKGDTLSEHIWKWARVRGKGAGWNIRRIGLLVFLGWLLLHLGFGLGPT
jgi:hypothetical protein